MWDDDSDDPMDFQRDSDLVDQVEYNVADVPAEKDFKSATAQSKSITVRRIACSQRDPASHVKIPLIRPPR